MSESDQQLINRAHAFGIGLENQRIDPRLAKEGLYRLMMSSINQETSSYIHGLLRLYFPSPLVASHSSTEAVSIFKTQSTRETVIYERTSA